MFIRVGTSESGVFDITLGEAGQVLVSNGPNSAPTWQDLPTGAAGAVSAFSYTQDWEKEHADSFGGFRYGAANFTAEFERGSAQATGAHGPACYTSAGDHPWAKRV